MEVIMLGAMHVPTRTFEWLNTKLTDRARHELRVVLRGLERACDAAAAVLWTEDSAMAQVVVQLVGDDTTLPDRRRLPRLERSQPTRESWGDAGGNAHDAVVFKIAMGGAVPRMGLAIVDPRGDAPALFDAIEDAATDIERVVIGSIEVRAKMEVADARRATYDRPAR